jgi:GcrA cell cycle regulator
MTWTDERVAELARLWESGHSASAIGRILGVSKNAVVGKAHRLRLSSRPSPIRHERRTPVRRRIPMLTRPVETPQTTLPEPEPPVEEPRIVTRRDGKGPTCLWPIGDPRQADFRFCEAPAMEGKPYCASHCARAYISRPTRAEDRAA